MVQESAVCLMMIICHHDARAVGGVEVLSTGAPVRSASVVRLGGFHCGGFQHYQCLLEDITVIVLSADGNDVGEASHTSPVDCYGSTSWSLRRQHHDRMDARCISPGVLVGP